MNEEKTIYDIANFDTVANYIMCRIDDEIPRENDKKYEQKIEQILNKYIDKKNHDILAGKILDVASDISYHYFATGMHAGARLLLELLDL